MSVDEIVLWLFVMCLPAVNLYPIFFAFRPWSATAQGKALMVKALGNMMIVDVTCLYLWFGEYPGRDLIRVVGFTAFLIGVNWLLVSLIFSPGARRYPPWSWIFRDPS